ncbi:MAG: hypothetical protein AAB605_01030 [Patescibacteria group bacterium]
MHAQLAEGRWQQLTLAEQMGNIGSEVSRAATAFGKNEARLESALIRGLELFDLTLADPRWKGRKSEIGRAREVFCDAVLGGKEYGTTFPGLQKYFDQFALASRRAV